MSAPSIPPDNSLQIEQQREAEARRQQEVADKKAAEEKARLATLRDTAISGAGDTTRSYFTQQGLDPNEYASQIDAIIRGIAGGVGPEDPNPGSYFNNVGQTVWDQLQTAAQNKAQRDVNSLFTTGYENTRLPFTLDDPYAADILSEQQQSAEDIINNMLSRHVITDTGAAAAEKNLQSQLPGIRSRLRDIGTGILTGGQQQLSDEANKARQAAQTLSLGNKFDVNTYSSEADRIYNEFVNSLSDQLRAAVPGSLFDTSGLAAVAGAGSGSQNTKFDPAALAGIFSESGTDKNKNKTQNDQGYSIF